MRYFVDTNILMDLFLGREPFVENAILLFENVKEKNWKIYTSDNSITTSYYYLEKEKGHVISKATIATFLTGVEIVSVTKEMLINAAHSSFRDFEDAVQFQCAAKITSIDGILTRNKKDFKQSSIPVYTPEEVLLF